MDVNYQVTHRLPVPTLARKFDISHWFPYGANWRAHGDVVTQISWTDTYRSPHFLRYGAPLDVTHMGHLMISPKPNTPGPGCSKAG